MRQQQPFQRPQRASLVILPVGASGYGFVATKNLPKDTRFEYFGKQLAASQPKDANCKLVINHCNGAGTNAYVVTKRATAQGEELTMNYGSGYKRAGTRNSHGQKCRARLLCMCQRFSAARTTTLMQPAQHSSASDDEMWSDSRRVM